MEKTTHFKTSPPLKIDQVCEDRIWLLMNNEKNQILNYSPCNLSIEEWEQHSSWFWENRGTSYQPLPLKVIQSSKWSNETSDLVVDFSSNSCEVFKTFQNHPSKLEKCIWKCDHHGNLINLKHCFPTFSIEMKFDSNGNLIECEKWRETDKFKLTKKYKVSFRDGIYLEACIRMKNGKFFIFCFGVSFLMMTFKMYFNF